MTVESVSGGGTAGVGAGQADVTGTGAPPNVRRERHLLGIAIACLPEWSACRDLPAPTTAQLLLAQGLASALPDDRVSPRVAVDEDGDVMMAWGRAGEDCALTFEGDILHVVVSPGARSTHLAPVAYAGGPVPPAVLDVIPRR